MKQTNEAVIVLCKCGEAHKTFGIRAERTAQNEWTFTWAFPIKEASVKREGYDHTSIKGDLLFAEEYPGCPYCGSSNYTLCSDCGHLNCTVTKNNLFTCEWCGNKGTVGRYNGENISAGMDL